MIGAMNPQESSLPDTYVKPVPRCYSCVTVLDTFVKPIHPPIIIVGLEKTIIIIYVFVDVSWSSFGSTLLQKEGNPLSYWHTE